MIVQFIWKILHSAPLNLSFQAHVHLPPFLSATYISQHPINNQCIESSPALNFYFSIICTSQCGRNLLLFHHNFNVTDPIAKNVYVKELVHIYAVMNKNVYKVHTLLYISVSLLKLVNVIHVVFKRVVHVQRQTHRYTCAHTHPCLM